MPFDYPGADAQPSAPGATEGKAVELKPYDVTINGVNTTLKLSDEDAEKQGLLKTPPPVARKVPAKKAPAPANKARKAPNKKG